VSKFTHFREVFYIRARKIPPNPAEISFITINHSSILPGRGTKVFDEDYMIRVYCNLLAMKKEILVKKDLKSLERGNEEKHLYFNLYDAP
jgi:hypothetical protein